MHICVLTLSEAQMEAKAYTKANTLSAEKIYIYIDIYVYIGDIANRWFNYVLPLKPLTAIIYIYGPDGISQFDLMLYRIRGNHICYKVIQC